MSTYIYSPEYGLPNVMVFKPLSMHDWSRLDDPIDFVQETYLQAEPQIHHVSVFPHALHPWSGAYMNARTGERLPRQAVTAVRTQNAIRAGHQPPFPERMDPLARELGFEDWDDLDANLAPLVPIDIRYLTEFLGVFTDPDVWKQLRPMLYTYWA